MAFVRPVETTSHQRYMISSVFTECSKTSPTIFFINVLFGPPKAFVFHLRKAGLYTPGIPDAGSPGSSAASFCPNYRPLWWSVKLCYQLMIVLYRQESSLGQEGVLIALPLEGSKDPSIPTPSWPPSIRYPQTIPICIPLCYPLGRQQRNAYRH